MTNGIEWEFSSAGRASALQAEGHRFEPCNSHQFSLKFPNGPVVQLVRTPPCHGGGRGFESHPGRHYADLAHLVERHLAKVEVASSSLVIRSNKEFVVEVFTAFFLRFFKAEELFLCFFIFADIQCIIEKKDSIVDLLKAHHILHRCDTPT